ncbi:MAG: SulP family inorganic anion transporter [Rhizomicrobium sp.]
MRVEGRQHLASWIPGFELLRTYRREWLGSDVVAGISVAAVALPVGIAYARLAGFAPVVGIYASILPAVAYALFGSSRQLIVNPDAAACAIVAATLVPLAGGDPGRYADLSITLTLLTGLFCIVGGLVGFGVIANFLSRPILTGYLNGIALSIIAGQLGTLFGYKVPSGGFFRMLVEVAARLSETRPATLALGLGLLAGLWILKRISVKIPAPLVAVILGIAAVYALHLTAHGVAVVGPVPPGFPAPKIPSIRENDLWPLIFGAADIVLVSFCSMMTTARGFAARNHYPINANQDMVALGICDVASAFSQGFVVSGADSRTAVADTAGGKTQLTAIVAAVAMAAVLFFLTAPLAYMPVAALAAILISSATSLFDFTSLRSYYRVSKGEFLHAAVAMIGVMTLGVLPGVLIAIALALLRLLRLASRPHDAILGLKDATEGSYCSEEEGGQPVDGIVIYRFDASIVFFNADYFKSRALAAVGRAGGSPRWMLFDVESVPFMDITGADALEALRSELHSLGIVVAIARAKGLFRMMLQHSGVAEKIGAAHLFASVHTGVQTFLNAPQLAQGECPSDVAISVKASASMARQKI